MEYIAVSACKRVRVLNWRGQLVDKCSNSRWRQLVMVPEKILYCFGLQTNEATFHVDQ